MSLDELLLRHWQAQARAQCLRDTVRAALLRTPSYASDIDNLRFFVGSSLAGVQSNLAVLCTEQPQFFESNNGDTSDCSVTAVTCQNCSSICCFVLQHSRRMNTQTADGEQDENMATATAAAVYAIPSRSMLQRHEADAIQTSNLSLSSQKVSDIFGLVVLPAQQQLEQQKETTDAIDLNLIQRDQRLLTIQYRMQQKLMEEKVDMERRIKEYEQQQRAAFVALFERAQKERNILMRKAIALSIQNQEFFIDVLAADTVDIQASVSTAPQTPPRQADAAARSAASPSAYSIVSSPTASDVSGVYSPSKSSTIGVRRSRDSLQAQKTTSSAASSTVASSTAASAADSSSRILSSTYQQMSVFPDMFDGVDDHEDDILLSAEDDDESSLLDDLDEDDEMDGEEEDPIDNKKEEELSTVYQQQQGQGHIFRPTVKRQLFGGVTAAGQPQAAMCRVVDLEKPISCSVPISIQPRQLLESHMTRDYREQQQKQKQHHGSKTHDRSHIEDDDDGSESDQDVVELTYDEDGIEEKPFSYIASYMKFRHNLG